MLALVAAAAVLLPASADMVLSIDDVGGLRAALETAGEHAPSLSPAQVGASLRDATAVDPFADPSLYGLPTRGARLLVFSRDAVGLIAPVRDRKTARRVLAGWLAQNRRRAGRIVRGRLMTASGRGAPALLARMSRTLRLPPRLAASAKGPVWLWARLADPLQEVVLSIDAGGTGLVARGIVTAAGPLLAGAAPAGCAEAIACLRAGVGDAGRKVIANALGWLQAAPQPELAGAARVEERLEAIDARQLSDERSLARALRIAAVFGGPEGSPALDGRVDLARVDSALSGMTPLDALRGPAAAIAYAAHILYGRLLRNAGPLTVTGRPALGNAAEIEIRLPLR